MAEYLPKSLKVADNNCDGLKLKIRALFFDLDNTLISTRVGDAKACRKLSEVLESQFGISKDESAISVQTFLKSFRRCPDNSQTSLDSWRTYLWREALPCRHKHLAEQIYQKWLHLRYKYLALPPEHIQLLKSFRQSGFLLALITNGPTNAQWEKIRKLKVQQYFDCVLVSSDLPWEKPNPHIFFAACNFLGVKPNDCVMIGDKLETDIKGGKLANLSATFWIPLNQANVDLTDVEHPPTYTLRNLVDLYKHFPLHGSSSSSISSTNRNNSNHRGSHISRSTTTSTCNSDLNALRDESFQLYEEEQHDHEQSNGDAGVPSKYRRGGSLPAMECFNSETENSSDSMLI